MKTRNFLNYFKKATLLFSLVFFLTECNDEAITPTATSTIEDDLAISATSVSDCSTCTYVVPANKNLIDGAVLNLKPGSVICLNAATKYRNLLFRNIKGTADQPIIIRNCGGTASVDGTGMSYTIKTELSKYFKITGGDISKSYGIKLFGGQLGLTLDKLSTNFEVDHIEVHDVGFAGIMAKTDPTCDDATNRGHFTMYDISLHDNYVHNTGGEGFYVGNSFYKDGRTLSCGVRYAHVIEGVKIYNNIIKSSGWESIQLGSATKGAQVYNNTVENFGTKNIANQRNGIQIGEGTGGLCYGNYIKTGPGNGLIVLGLGDNIVHNNVIINAGGFGIFCDERVTPGPGFQFINNTIINPKSDGIRIYAEKVPMNKVINNIIVNPGSYSTYGYPRTGNDAYVYKLSTGVRVEMRNNYFTRNMNDLKFVDPTIFNYRLTSLSPAINKGNDISSFNIQQDFYKRARLKGAAYDIGASEY
jgi:hypothetical protein